ncbi:26S proteasome non-ATPase regulatory subunit 12, partial [Coelomomyces lativittatus]
DGQLNAALEQLMVLEKQTRNAGDVFSNARVQIHILQLCFKTNNLKLLNENIIALSKKHGALKQATQKVIQEAVTFVDLLKDKESKLELIEVLRVVTEGKIYVEAERARLTRILSKMKEDEGKIEEAAEILQEVQVETFGSMDKREKTDFILEQMRLCLLKKDFTRTSIISRKIQTKYFKDSNTQDLKLRFYELLIQYDLHEENYLNVCKSFREVFDTESVLADENKWKEILTFIVIFIVLSPYDNEQSDLIHRIVLEEKLQKMPVLQKFLKMFITPELIRWPKVEEVYGTMLRATYIFSPSTAEGSKRWADFRKRVIEHNLRMIAKYYSQITYSRLTELLDLTPLEVETFLSSLVSNKTIYAKIDRPAQLVVFTKPKASEEVLNDWSTNIHGLLKLLEKTTHLITKEEMVHSILSTKSS